MTFIPLFFSAAIIECKMYLLILIPLWAYFLAVILSPFAENYLANVWFFILDASRATRVFFLY